MTEAQQQEIKEYIFTAVQAGKKETSDLVDSILRKIEPAIAVGIEKNVNGHMRDMKAHLEQQDSKLAELPAILTELTRVAEELKKVKERTDPLVESRMTVLNVGRFVIWLGAISGATAGIIWLVDKLKDIK